jgi:hypothetical protein
MVANVKSKSSIESLAGISSMVAVDYSGGDVVLARISRTLSCNVSGTVVLIMEDDGSTTSTRFMNAGQDYPWRVKTVKNSGTTVGMGIYAGY